MPPYLSCASTPPVREKDQGRRQASPAQLSKLAPGVTAVLVVQASRHQTARPLPATHHCCALLAQSVM